MSSRSQPVQGTLFTNLLLATVVPAVLFGILEVTCRVLDLESRFARAHTSPQVLEMPTWMLREDNVRARLSTQTALDPDALEWMSLFREGDGFRVHLKPSIERSIKNTFSLVASDRDRRYFVTTNSLGFRGRELLAQKPQNTFRVLAFGDSSSFGWGVDQDEMFTSLLEQSLRKANPGINIEVGNFAIPGDSSEYGRLVFDKFAKDYAPDLVLLGFGANDAKQVITPHVEQVERFEAVKEQVSIRSMLYKSALVRTMGQLLPLDNPAAKTAPSRPALTTAVPRKRFRTNLAHMAEASRSMGAQALILSLCSPSNYRRGAAELAEKKGLLHLDGQSLLLQTIPKLQRGELFAEEVAALKQSLGSSLREDGLLLVSSDGCHPNALGHRIVAEALASTIQAAELL